MGAKPSSSRSAGCFWQRNHAEGCWTRRELPASGLGFHRGAQGAMELDGAARPEPLALALPLKDGAAARAALISAAGARTFVNGQTALGLTVVAERDELLIGGERFYFTSRVPAAVGRYRSEDGAARCARCKRLLHEGDEVVRCPACLAFHHAGVPAEGGAGLACWQHDARCAACTGIREALVWSPEEELGDG